MESVSVANDQSTENFSAPNLLEKLANSRFYGCLQVTHGSVSWLIYFEQGKLTYATHSVEPFERLERHLRRWSKDASTLINAVRTETRLYCEIKSVEQLLQRREYRAICWLLEKKYIQPAQAETFIRGLTKEALETFLLVTNTSNRKLIKEIDRLPALGHFDLLPFLAKCQESLQGWQALAPHIQTPYQRPYFANQAHNQNSAAAEKLQKLGRILKGLNFHQLAALLHQDELLLAQKLHSLVANQTLILRTPQSPFDRLPKFATAAAPVAKKEAEAAKEQSETNSLLPQKADSSFLQGIPANNQQKTWKVVCVDDSPTVLNEINRILEDPNIVVTKVSDPLKALVQIIKNKPDLILLDVGMPNIDGYNLCSLIRKNNTFKSTPIIMVTGNKGLIDRAKAKLVGATDYLTKPFTQAELLNIVFKYLN